MINRRSLLLGLIAAPVVIRTPGLLMRVRSILPECEWSYFNPSTGIYHFRFVDFAEHIEALQQMQFSKPEWMRPLDHS